MNIIKASDTLNVQHDADHLVVKAAWHALAKRHHPDTGGNTFEMQKINEAYNYMSTRTQAARLAEWERLQPKSQPPQPPQTEKPQSWRVGQFDEYVAAYMAEKASKTTPPPASSTTRPWKPTPTRRQRWSAWLYCQPRPVRWLVKLSQFLAILAGRLAVVAGMFFLYAEGVRWGVKALAHGAWALLIIFPGIMIVLAGFMVTVIVALNFLHGGWKGLGNYFMDRGSERLPANAASEAWARKNAGNHRTRWL